MNEQLLQFIWKFRLFDNSHLLTTSGESVEIIHTGMHNSDAGPDFQNARVKIGSTLWAGNVELHVKSSDWFRHSHHTDKSYSNVILHVVYEHDGKPAKRENGESIPVLEVKEFVNPNTLSRYELLGRNQKAVACSSFFPDAAQYITGSFLTRLLVERLEEKVERINGMLKEHNGDWEQVTFCLIARYWGAGVNSQPLELLAKSLPHKLLAKTTEPLQIEALLFGQAGWLNDKAEDDYPNQLRKEYLYLKRLYNLEPLPGHIWKLLRLRPANFPTIRIAQLAALFSTQTHLFSSLLEAKDIKAIHRFFDVRVSPYWETHYLFDKPSAQVKSNIGASAKNILLINAVVPLLFAYGKYKGNETYCDRALQLLEMAKPESNNLLKDWNNLGVKPSSAFDSQALLQLRNHYCNRFRCLECAVGLSILK
jgi:hypothetical protein